MQATKHQVTVQPEGHAGHDESEIPAGTGPKAPRGAPKAPWRRSLASRARAQRRGQ